MPLRPQHTPLPSVGLLPAARLERRAVWFAAATLVASLTLQRFAVPVSGKALSIVSPVGLGLMAIGFANGALRFHRARLLTYLAFCTALLCGAIWQSVKPPSLGGAENTNSRVLFVLLTSFTTCTFTASIAEATYFRLVTSIFMVVAMAGILQFFAQFVGLGLFSFTGHLPDSILVESFYHLEIPVGVGGLLKSNGLLLIEPSVFSQIMALALIIEAIGQRRAVHVGVFTAALILSFSGTGWIVLSAFVVGSGVGMGKRGIAIAAGVTALLGLVLAVLMLAAPEFAATLTSRLTEINEPGTSGHMRFITPFWMLRDVFSAEPSAFLFGIGSGKSETLTLPYDYAINTAIKVLAEYGLPTLIAYVLLFVIGRKTRMQAALVLPTLVLFFLAGGYQDFAPVLFIVLLLSVVPRLHADPLGSPMGSMSAIGPGRLDTSPARTGLASVR